MNEYVVSGRPPIQPMRTMPVSIVSDEGDTTGVADGRKVVTTAGTRVALASSTPCKRIMVAAETDNTGLIVVGGATVVASLATRQGFPLYAADWCELEADDLAEVYIDSTVSGDGVTFIFST